NDVQTTVRIDGERQVSVAIDLPLTGVSERVDVIGNAETSPPTIGETLSTKGGRSNQSGLQIGMAALTDSTTGAPLFSLPVDAIDSVEVLPNPYSVEFGRFSSGMTVVNTKRAHDVWRIDLSAPDLSFRTERGKPWPFTGIESFGPRIGFG